MIESLLIDSMPDDTVLRSEDDLRPYIAALGRAWSTLALVRTEPLGRLPGGQRCADTLEGTNADPTQPLISQLFSHLAYQDDREESTRALYVLSDFQNLITCSNRSDLVRLDRGLSSSFELLTQRLVTRHKTVLAVAFHDHALPAALLLFEAGRSFYTPRAYRMLTAPLDFKPRFEPIHVPADYEIFAFSDNQLPESPVIIGRPFDSTVSSYLYCNRPAAHYTLSRFGIWLPDTLQGGRLYRARLGNASTCDFLSRITDLSRLGAGDCPLLQLVYSGYQCRSARTCNIPAPGLYQLGERPGSSLSPVNQFGIAKTFARDVNCNSPGTSDGSSGYGTQRPGTDCLVTGDDLIAQAQNPFLQCLVASQAGGPIEPPKDPWKNQCPAVDCAEGEQCEPEPPAQEEMPKENLADADSDGDVDDDDKHCDAKCEGDGILQHKGQNFLSAIAESFDTPVCPDCMAPGWQVPFASIVNNPNYAVSPNVNLNPGGITTNPVEAHTTPDGKTIQLDQNAIRTVAYDRAAPDHGFRNGAQCAADPICAMDALKNYVPVVEREALVHELGHVVFEAAIEGGRTDIFTREAQSAGGYLGIFNHLWEDKFIFKPGECSENPAACSAVHDFIRHLQSHFNYPGRGGRSCGVEGGCSEGCGANSLTKYQACDALADLIRMQYRDRIAPVYPPPAPNQLSIAAECRFPGCFGDGIPTIHSACPFALCTGASQLGNDIACDCCSMCDPAPIITGYSPTCQNEPSCEQCCRWCNVSPGAECPPTFTPTALEVPPAWQLPLSPQ
jgi:hypothetical protein